MSHASKIFGAAALLGTLLASNAAFAYCRTMACSNKDPMLACSTDSNGCLVNDRPLYWPTSCISFGIQEDGSRADNISYEAMRQIVDTAFQTWISADCGGTMPAVAIENYGAIECADREYNSDQANANVFMFRDADWPYENAQDTLALTTITFNVDTGEIYDADVEVNSFDANLTVDDVDVVADLPSIITHEVGHFLGLSHSNVRAATMRPGYNPGDTGLRTLDADDVMGVCALFPTSGAQPAECDPRHGFSRQCAVTETGCCAVQGTRPRSSAPLALLALGAALVAVRRRRRQTAGA
jgi:MYXO-CTERM domain-containing protein